jgi:bifunctional DNA-binding transcriptional regulator/antitoxin component of YhaV-PrlF toxin-antitoxin module
VSATIVSEKNQTTLPDEIVEAAGIRPNDQVDWSFENGKIIGRKLAPEKEEKPGLTVVKRNGHYMLSGNITREEILAAIRADREPK